MYWFDIYASILVYIITDSFKSGS